MRIAKHTNIFYLLFVLTTFTNTNVYSQGSFPWERPLEICYSTDGITFSTPQIFQDSSGVPSVTQLPSGILISAFQWFRQPMGSATWDKVAVKFSSDSGLTWTPPQPIVIANFPINFQRPFDPTLAITDSGQIRIFYSSSNGMPTGGLDSTVNTYSAVSNDGINYTFEPGARFDHPTNRVIDPAVIQFKNLWHYLSPIAAPQDGAYHAISSDGINFSQVPDVPSDMMHNWTGNYCVADTNELRFYGCGPQNIWYAPTINGGMWQPYVTTNISGGDPAVVKTSSNIYVMIFTGAPYTTGVLENNLYDKIKVYPNPVKDFLNVTFDDAEVQNISVTDAMGKTVYRNEFNSAIKNSANIDIRKFAPGSYILSIRNDKEILFKNVIVLK